MRLQLTVQRHGLPPVQVLWTLASAVRPPLLAVGNSITISQFLEQVNEVLPLESEDWGLEDYSVEVRGFECLHFSELNQVLKEDDEVCIRPLQTQDLRFRKISGRHQIAADGKHLVDGVAFGRPFLRRADRPAIRIPPRKRKRITYDQEDDFDTQEPNSDRQVIVRAGFDDADEATPGDESYDEADFAPDDEEEDDLGAEIEDLQNDIGGGADADEGVSPDDGQPQRTARSRRSPKGLGLLQLLDEDGKPFAGQYSNPLLDIYGQDEPPNSRPKIRVSKRRTAKLGQNSSENIRSILRDSSASPQRVSRWDSAGSGRSVRFESADSATPATIQESEDSEDADDGDFQLDEVDESDKENAEPQVEETESSDSFFEGSQSSSTTSSDDQISDDETSSSGSSSSDSSSDSEPGQHPTKDIDNNSETSETSSSGSSSSSSSESEPEPPKTVQKRKWAVYNVKPKPLANKATSLVTASAATTTPPGSGSNLTRSRNKRRKESKKLKFIKSKGILPAAATKSDLRKFEEGTSYSERQDMVAVGGVREAVEAKRQALLTSIAAGGIDVSPDPSQHEKDAEKIEDQWPVDDPLSKAAATHDNTKTHQPASEDRSSEVEPKQPSANDPISSSTSTKVPDSTAGSPAKAKETPLAGSISTTTTSAIVPDLITGPPGPDDSPNTSGAMEASKAEITPVPEPQNRRSKLDMSSAKRMLFGSLGVKPPKTKDDETKTREKLMKDVRPIKEPQVNEKIETVEDVAAAAEDENWKDKIDLRAVECCYDGIKLSTPPFPFVQRWDPQQQRGHKTGKAKNRKRNNEDYYEDSSFRPENKVARRSNPDYMEDSSYNLQSKVVRLNDDDWQTEDAKREPSTEKANPESKDQERSYDENFEDSVRANEQLLHETEDASADTLVDMEKTHDLTNDLPILPEDLSICSCLTLDTAAKGNVVAFKQLEMSAETNWQPRISEYRTAIVDAILDDGTISLTLAKRDQLLQDVQYDEQTGERLYSKFEMPGYHDENGEDDNGKVEVSFDELINPVLVEVAGEKGNQNDVLQAQHHIVAPPDSNDKAVTEEVHDMDAIPQSVGLDGAIQELYNEEAVEPSEEARQEISELIRDAGWRSSVRSEVNDKLIDRQDGGPISQRDNLSEPALVAPPSPMFHGFSSSPLANRVQVESSPPPVALQTSRPVHASGSEIAESVPPRGPDDSPARSIISNRRSAVDYPDLPQINDDSEVFQQEAQDRSGLLEADHQIASQDLILPGNGRSPSQSIVSPTLTSPNMDNVFDGPDSDESLPELFSQAFEKRMSQGREIKQELSEEDPISPPSQRKSKRNSRIDSSQRESNRDWEPDYSEGEYEDDGASTPGPSQPVYSSQIVDLTISSDTVDPPDDSYNDDDSYVLPTGPGWVQKPRTSEHRDGATKKTTTRRSTRGR